MSLADGTRFRQRLDERNEPGLTPDSLGRAQRHRVVQHVLQQTTLPEIDGKWFRTPDPKPVQCTVQEEIAYEQLRGWARRSDFSVKDSRLLGGFYKGAGQGRRPTAVLVHGLPGIEKNLDIAYRRRRWCAAVVGRSQR